MNGFGIVLKPLVGEKVGLIVGRVIVELATDEFA
jgi:hypothetical protein